MTSLVTIRAHTFFPLELGPDSVVIDAGANIGSFSREFKERFGCTPYAIEPNPASAAQITAARVFNHALGAQTKLGEFFIGPSSEGCSLLPHPDHTESTVVPIVELGHFLREQGLSSVDLLKLDIEGAELELLLGLTDSIKIAQISVEFHDFMFHEQREQVARVIRHMKSIGFRCFNFSSPANEDILFVNTRMVRLTLKHRMRANARVVARHWRRQLTSTTG
jgi:FkbM family methyltransferase